MSVIKWESKAEEESNASRAEEERIMEETLKNTQLDYMIDLDFRLSMIELGL